ncbi:T9SS type A sorting domain-containing protein [Fluviicola taffensis]|uniref:DUF7619 domain-containing protein n=1 Tax=Fluviicola taffensis TaxID=191579 RepID=UPI003137B85A
MKTLLLTILAFVSLQLNAQTWVQVPDANFQTYLTANYPASAFMTSGGNFFVDSDHADIQSTTSLNISSLSISTIDGIAAFEKLNILDCHGNNLTSLSGLSDSIVSLNCSYNQLTALPTLPMNLASLECQQNQLTALPAWPAHFSALDCSNNQITALPNPLPTNMGVLKCSNNQLTQLPALPSSLSFLYCVSNQLTQMPALPNLVYFYCGYNQLTSLPVLPNTLEQFGCESNQLSALPDLPNVPNGLYHVMCNDNQLTVLPDLPATLSTLSCSNNQLTSLPILPAGLTALVCELNQLTELPDLPDSLNFLACAYNQITCFAPFSEVVDNVLIGNNPFTCLPNYTTGMLPDLLAYPLCDENDPVNNPNGCTGANGIEGMVFHDINNDCIPAGGVVTYIPMSVYDSTGNLMVTSTSLANGNYYFSAGPGSYELEIETSNLTPSLQVTCPVGNSSNAVVPFTDTVVSGGDFGLNCAGFDLGVQSIVPNGWVFPGQTHELNILAGDVTAQYNMHCASGILGEVTIAVTGPGVITFGGSPSTVSANTAVYSITDFGILNANEFIATILTDTTAIAGDEFCVTVSVATNASGELDITNNLYSYCYNVVNSYDPNVKETFPEVVQPGYTDEFTYTIHFQNTGNAPAMNIRLADTLDSNLDLSTFKVVNASHPFTTTLNSNTRLLIVRFPNIMLPDSTSDSQGSIGFIQYRVKPLPGLTNGTIIHNTAYIYFDYNAPIVTNTTENVFFTDLGLGEWNAETIQLYPNPAENEFLVRAEREIDQITLSDINGKQVVSDFPHAKTTSVDVSDLKQGVYIVTIKTNQSIITKRLIVR